VERIKRDSRMSKSGKSGAYRGQSRKREGRLRAMKPEKLSQRASRDEEEKRRKIMIKSRERCVLSQIHHPCRHSSFYYYCTFFTLLPHNLSA
jgi:hypothetical protein